MSDPASDAPTPKGLLQPDAEIVAVILRLVTERGAQKSVDPSEVAQAIGAPGEPWQRHLTRVRKVAATMARDGSISILRHNKVISPDAIKGVVRLTLPRAAAETEVGQDLPLPNPCPEGDGLDQATSKPLPFRGGVGEGEVRRTHVAAADEPALAGTADEGGA